jgi:outer membrane protein, adhesin transport system
MYSIFLYKNIKKLSLSFMLGLAALPAPLVAMELNDFVADSISAHPSIREQVHIFRQVDRDRDIADSGWHPSVDLEASTGTYETESPTTGLLKREYESTRAELSITQNLFNGFDTTYQQQQARARISSALFEIYDTADNIALDAVQAYLDVVKQQKLIELAETNVTSHERILSQIRERNDSGMGRRSELQQTEGRVARAYASLIAQQNNFQDAATRMHEILGRYVQLTRLKEPALPEHPGLTLEQLIDRALEKHPAIKVAGFNVQAALSDSSRARRNNYPKVDLRFAKEVGDDIGGLNGDTDEMSLVLNLSYNLYRGGADRAAERKKVSGVYQNQEFAARVRRQVINTLRLAWVADQSLSRQLKFLTTHIEKAQQTVESYGEEFFIGQRDLIDLLDAESELNSAQNQHTEAYYEALAARFRIHEAMGELFPTLSLDVSVGEEDLQISKIRALGDDVLPLDPDRDADKEKNIADHCDNTRKDDQVNDFGCHNKQSVKFGYNQVNRAPVVGDDQMELEMNSALVIPQNVLLENDTDADGDDLRLINFTQPKNGALAFNDKKSLIYRAADGFTGSDNFSYTVTDGQGAVATAWVKLNVVAKTDMQLTKTQFVNFIYKKTTLAPGSQAKIEDIVSKLRTMPYNAIEIFAYTDNIGSDSYNLALSERRAKATRELLISRGLDGSKIKAYGMGERNPIADNATPEGQAINRRGELLIKFGSSSSNKPRALLERKIN